MVRSTWEISDNTVVVMMMMMMMMMMMVVVDSDDKTHTVRPSRIRSINSFQTQ